jgi:hypothetical protein
MPIADGIPCLLLDGADEFNDCNQLRIHRITTRSVVVVAFPGYVGNGAQQHHVSLSPGLDDEVDGFEAFFFLVLPKLNPINFANDSM